MKNSQDIKQIIYDKDQVIIMYKDDFELEHGCVAFNYDCKKITDSASRLDLFANASYIFIENNTPSNFLDLIVAKISSNVELIFYYDTSFTEEQMQTISILTPSKVFQENFIISERKILTCYCALSKQSEKFILKHIPIISYTDPRNNVDNFTDEIIQKNKENKLSIGQAIKEKIALNPDLVYIVPDGIIPSLQSLILAQHFDNENIEEVIEKYFFNSSVNDANLETIKAPSNLPEISHKRDEKIGHIVK